MPQNLTARTLMQPLVTSTTAEAAYQVPTVMSAQLYELEPECQITTLIRIKEEKDRKIQVAGRTADEPTIHIIRNILEICYIQYYICMLSIHFAELSSIAFNAL